MAVFQLNSVSHSSQLEENLWGYVALVTRAECIYCCHPVHSVKALKEKQTTVPLSLSLFTTTLLVIHFLALVDGTTFQCQYQSASDVSIKMGVKNCDEHAYGGLCIFMQEYLKNNIFEVHQIFCACCLWL